MAKQLISKLKMADITYKGDTLRTATATAVISTKPEVIKLIKEKKIEKGDVFTVAKIAGIMAAKKTSDIVPLCHPLLLTKVNISINIENKNIIKVESRVVTCGKTGPDVEAMISASIAAVSIYDMCKQFDRAMSINNVSLEEKTGGKSGKYVRKASKKRS